MVSRPRQNTRCGCCAAGGTYLGLQCIRPCIHHCRAGARQARGRRRAEQERSRSGAGVERAAVKHLLALAALGCRAVCRANALLSLHGSWLFPRASLPLIASDSGRRRGFGGYKRSTTASEDFVKLARPPPVEATAFWLVGLTPSSGRESIGVALPPRHVAFSRALVAIVATSQTPIHRLPSRFLPRFFF